MTRPIVFLTDYGRSDAFVGICHGIMARIAPDSRVIDITHSVPRQDVLRGAIELARAVPYMPEDAVYVAVVDPGVGSDRRAVATVAGSSLLVGPDNGVLSLAWEALGGVGSAVEIENPAVLLMPVSRTFHGRDVFAPAAAHLALGVEPAELGPPLALDALARLDIPMPKVREGSVDASVLYIDRFGNMQLNMTRDDLDRVGLVPGTRFELELAGERYYATAARTYADARPGEIVLYEDSYRNIAIAINRGSAAEMFSAQPGQHVLLHLEQP